MSKDANSFGHDKALAWESRGFVYTKRGCIVSTHPRELLFNLTFEYAVYFVSAQYTPAMMRAAPTNAIIVIRSSNIIREPVSDTIGVRYR